MILSFIFQIILFSDNAPGYSVIAGLLFIYGIGNGLVLPSILNVSLKGIKSELAGTASGVYSTLQQLSSALGISIIGGVFLTLLQYAANYRLAYSVSLIVMGVYLLIVILLLNKLRQSKQLTKFDQSEKVHLEL